MPEQPCIFFWSHLLFYIIIEKLKLDINMNQNTPIYYQKKKKHVMTILLRTLKLTSNYS